MGACPQRTCGAAFRQRRRRWKAKAPSARRIRSSAKRKTVRRPGIAGQRERLDALGDALDVDRVGRVDRVLRRPVVTEEVAAVESDAAVKGFRPGAREAGADALAQRVEHVPRVEAVHPAQVRLLAVLPRAVLGLVRERIRDPRVRRVQEILAARFAPRACQQRADKHVRVVNRRPIADQIAEVGTLPGRRLRNAAEEEPACREGPLQQPGILGALVGVEQGGAGEGGRDRVRRSARVEEHARLDVEVIAPAELVEILTTQGLGGFAQRAPASLRPRRRAEAVPCVRGPDRRDGGGAAAGRDPEQRAEVERRPLDSLGHDLASRDRALQEPREAGRVQAVVGIAPGPVSVRAPRLEAPCRFDDLRRGEPGARGAPEASCRRRRERARVLERPR